MCDSAIRLFEYTFTNLKVRLRANPNFPKIRPDRPDIQPQKIQMKKTPMSSES